MEDYDGRGQQKDSLVFSTILSGRVGIIDKWQRVVELCRTACNYLLSTYFSSEFCEYCLKL